MACILSLELCCGGPWFTSIQEDGCDKGAHQSYHGAERNTLVTPDWFQPCQCCCCLCYPGKYLRLGTLNSYNWVQVLEACDSVVKTWFSMWLLITWFLLMWFLIMWLNKSNSSPFVCRWSLSSYSGSEACLTKASSKRMVTSRIRFFFLFFSLLCVWLWEPKNQIWLLVLPKLLCGRRKLLFL